jgi:hypothetical protein
MMKTNHTTLGTIIPQENSYSKLPKQSPYRSDSWTSIYPWGKSMKMSLHGILTIEEAHEINENLVNYYIWRKNWSGEPIR